MIFTFITKPSPMCCSHCGLIQLLLPPRTAPRGANPTGCHLCPSLPQFPFLSHSGSGQHRFAFTFHPWTQSRGELSPAPPTAIHPSTPFPWLVQASSQLNPSTSFPKIASFFPKAPLLPAQFCPHLALCAGHQAIT